MPAFEYLALNSKNKQIKGIIEADSERHLRQQLREKSLIPLNVKNLKNKKKSAAGKKFSLSTSKKLKSADLVIITRQLANLIRAALPIDEAIRTIAEHNNTTIRKVLSETRSRVVEGTPLSKSLKEQGVFSEEYSSTIAAGERSGDLAKILEKLADDIERKDKFLGRMKTAMIYPAVIAFVSITAVIALLTYVVPQVVEVFTSSNRQLPVLTILMINISDFLRQYGQALLFLLIISLIAFRLSLRVKSIHLKWHSLLMKFPLIGKMFVGSNNSQFARNFSLMQSAGVPVLDSLRITANTLSCLPMQQAIYSATEMVREGSTIFNALQKFNALPPMTLYMLASGEASGKLSDMMERAAINQEHELEQFTTSMLAVLEPAIMLVMGGFVLLIVLSILLPIFELNQAI
jgi:general secretion pathway protein F